MQGACSNAVRASAGTHGGCDACDTTRYNIFNRVKFGRMIGGNYHFRRALAGVWSAHGHFTRLFSKCAASGAKNQNDSWMNRPFGSGLASGGKALDFLPDSSKLEFLGKTTATRYAKSNGVTGYSQANAVSKREVVRRKAGWSFKPIGRVKDHKTGKVYVFNASPTFYPEADLTTSKPASAPATPAPVVKSEDALNPKSYGPGHEGLHVTWLGQRIVIWLAFYGLKADYLVGPGPVYGPTDNSSMKKLQEKWSPGEPSNDGYPGARELARLAKDPR